MKFLGRKRVRTCLSMLLIVTCLLASFSFYIDSRAQDRLVENFYILDEEGNPVVIENPNENSTNLFGRVRLRMFATSDSSVQSRANTIGVVRFQSASGDDTVDYIEYDTGRAGYFHWQSAGDAAYLGEEDGYVICKLSGVVMKVPKKFVRGNPVAYSDCGEKKVSYYSNINGYLVHTYTIYNDAEVLTSASTRVGYALGYLSTGNKYYSYDGHYFYDDFAKMISDYRSGIYNNAVNADTPYYNYYQYLSFHTTAPFTAEQYNAHVAEKNKPDSVMLTTGTDFVAAQDQYTINALLMFGIAVNESGWGTNKYSQKKYNNIFSINAVDSNPDNAKYFETLGDCINQFAYEYMHKKYLNGTDFRYRGPHLGDKHSGINVKYASDPYWGEKAAARAYYVDTNKIDYGRYTIGIATKGKVQFYKEADTASTKIYTSEAGEGNGKAAYMYDFPVAIIEEVTGSNNEKFYKVISDMSLNNGRTARAVDEIFNPSQDYVYVRKSDIKKVFEGSGDITLPDITPPNPSVSQKTHAEVLAKLNVSNSSNYLTGFSVGSDVERAIAKVRALDSNIQVVVKRADGTQITSGTVATGMQMTITTNGSTVTYSIVIRGDVSGDGKLSAIDYVKLRNYLDGASSLSGSYLKGADTSGDGKASALDYVKLRNHLDNKSAIVQ